MKFKVLLVGIGGYGNVYVDALLNSNDKDILIEGIVDPNPKGCTRYRELIENNIPIYNNIDCFYKKHNADLAVISSPIQFHKEQTIKAIKYGSSVLCEKPISALISEANEMIEASNKYNKKLAIGFQWSFSDAIVNLKKDIKKGIFGKAVKLKTLVLWPRDSNYYKRNNWAGKIRNGKGDWILDSVANNATAHYLHNMMFVLGDQINSSTIPKFIEAEVYKANEIENYDTAAFRIKTDDGIPLLYLVSHAVENNKEPIFEYHFEKGIVKTDETTGYEIKAFFEDGSEKNYGDPFKNATNKLWDTIEAVKNDTEVGCLPEAAMQHTKVINAVQNKFSEIPKFNSELIFKKETDNNGNLRYVKDLERQLFDLYENWEMPYERKLKWSVKKVESNL